MEKCDTLKKVIDLYALCDSYIWMIIPSDTFYCNVDKWQFATVNALNYLHVKLDTAKANVLLLEFSERNTLYVLQQHYSYVKEFLTVNNTSPLPPPLLSSAAQSNSFLFNKNINSNLEFNIFESALFTPVKKLKAALNFEVFNSPDENVAVGPDKRYLLYRPTYDPLAGTSSFIPISDAEIDTSVTKLNAIYDHYKHMGFTQVYLSIIPNPVSILYPEYNGYKYNQLLQRIQNHHSLKMPTIDVFSDFKNADFPIYRKSDSHWNKDGAFLWLNKLNQRLRSIHK
jgi:hypothetical protein